MAKKPYSAHGIVMHNLIVMRDALAESKDPSVALVRLALNSTIHIVKNELGNK